MSPGRLVFLAHHPYPRLLWEVMGSRCRKPKRYTYMLTCHVVSTEPYTDSCVSTLNVVIQGGTVWYSPITNAHQSNFDRTACRIRYHLKRALCVQSTKCTSTSYTSLYFNFRGYRITRHADELWHCVCVAEWHCSIHMSARELAPPRLPSSHSIDLSHQTLIMRDHHRHKKSTLTTSQRLPFAAEVVGWWCQHRMLILRPYSPTSPDSGCTPLTRASSGSSP